jgi:hypothetical protein
MTGRFLIATRRGVQKRSDVNRLRNTLFKSIIGMKNDYRGWEALSRVFKDLGRGTKRYI